MLVAPQACLPLRCGKKTKTNIRVATWNLGSLNKNNSEVVETLSRWQVDNCGVQEHRFTGSLEPREVCTLTGKDCKFKFFFGAQAGTMLEENWQSYWSPAHIWQNHSSQTDRWQGCFHLPISVRTSSKPNWSWKGTFLWLAAMHCCQGSSHWDIYPSWWLKQSHWRFCRCVQQCPWWTQLQYP